MIEEIDKNEAGEPSSTPTGSLPGATATYSPEDNKLRLYPLSRLSRETYDKVSAAGFRWAPKQELFVAAGWTPAREDLLIDLVGEIDDENISLTERAADRAERFSGYRDRRAAEAHGRADRFDEGPQAFGHHSAQRAERAAARHDRHRLAACSQWRKAEYWQHRTAGVIASALHRTDARTRRGRILKLEAEQRKHLAELAEVLACRHMWEKVLTLDGAEEVRQGDIAGPGDDASKWSPAFLLAYRITNTGRYQQYTHPRTGRHASLYSHLVDEPDRLTPAEAARLALSGRDPDDHESHWSRWTAHYENRLAYENAMLAAEGGMLGELDIEPGGFVAGRSGGWVQVHGVTRSPKTGRVTSVKILVRDRNDKPALRSVSVERLGQGDYRPPTDAERETFRAATASRKAEEKANRPETVPLINPTEADAQRLQDQWNAEAKQKYDGKRSSYCKEYEPVTVARMTQAQYSAMSKGTYSHCEMSDITEDGRPKRHNDQTRVVVYKVRTMSSCRGDFHSPRRVVILTDKPQKPLPFDAVAAAKGRQPTENRLRHRMAEVYRLVQMSWLDHEKMTPEEKQLWADAQYCGLVWSSSSTQYGLTARGNELLDKCREIEADGGTLVPGGAIYAGVRAS